MILTVAAAHRLSIELLTAVGVPQEHAQVTAECIVLADVWNVSSHGLLRLPFYLGRLQAGGCNPNAELTVLSDQGAVVALDGAAGLGHWQVWHAAEAACRRCAKYGLSAVSVANSSHCGALGVYTVPALQAGMLGLIVSNGPAAMPAWGSDRAILSTSPLAAGLPTQPRPTIIDMATSAVPRGKIVEYARSERALPDGWALDRDGRPTVDPESALHGLLAPLGGAKGFALALLVEALSGGLAGPSLSVDVADMFDSASATLPQGIGHLVLTLNLDHFDAGAGDVKRRLDRLVALVDEFGGRVPGSRRELPTEISVKRTIALADSTTEQLADWARRLGVAWPTDALDSATRQASRSV